MATAAAELMRLAIPVLVAGACVPFALRALSWLLQDGTAFELLRAAVDALPEEVQRQLKGALYLSVPMALVGAIGGALFKVYQAFQSRASHYFMKLCQVSVMFSSRDKHYDAVVDYLGTHCAVETGKLMATTVPRAKPSFQEMLAHWLGGKTKSPTLYFQPDIQSFASSFKWTDEAGVAHKIWISRKVDKPQLRSDARRAARDPETVMLSLWWTRDVQPLKSFLKAALKTMLKEETEGRVDIYVKHMWEPIWTRAVSKERRDRDTVILDEDLADYVLADIRHFFTKKTADWYHSTGIPYRRGYLLYGPPGCGKTSFAQVLAGELGLDVCLMNLSNKEMNDDDLAELLRAAPGRSMLLLEDVDAVFVERASAKERQGGGGISFSGLLNALDGAAAQEGCVIVMTTNHKDRLDEALIRPGRCDVHVMVNKASKDQARRMFERFFSREVVIGSSDAGGSILTEAPHSFAAGTAVTYHFRQQEGALMSGGRFVQDHAVFYVGRCYGAQLALYDEQERALEGGLQGMLPELAGGKGARLRERLEVAQRFSMRIPHRQVSMAKLQGYLMKQKLLAEQELQKRALVGGEQVLSPDEVHQLASESAVMNVHELLMDEKLETQSQLTLREHLRRLGLHHFAPLFEHFGLRSKGDLHAGVVEAMGHWHPDLKIDSPQRRRLVALIEGSNEVDDLYALADLSVLRDRFLTAYSTGAKRGQQLPVVTLERAASAPAGGAGAGPDRESLLRLTHRSTPLDGLRLLETAHRFQEALEENGKSEVSMWQLEKHFERYAGDPEGALEHCRDLLSCKGDAQPEWCTTFGFLLRLGLEQHAWALEDKGLVLWNDWKDLECDKLKDEAEMSEADAKLCHAVAQGKAERADLLRKFQRPDFADLVALFKDRFPAASRGEALRFAQSLTDPLGFAQHSCLQVQKHLEGCKSSSEALHELPRALAPPAALAARRVRPKAPPPPEEQEDWLDKWLKEVELGHLAGELREQCLQSREVLLASPLDHASLQSMGLKKMGERQKLLQHIEGERNRG